MAFREKHYRWAWDFRAPPAALWPLVSNTDRFNRDCGFPPFQIRPDAQGEPRAGPQLTCSRVEPLERGAPVVTLRGNATATVQRILQQLGVFTSMLVPIMIENRHWGQIGFDDCESEHEWADDDIKILTMLAEVIGVAIVTVEERMRGWLAVIAKEKSALRQVVG